MGDIFAGLMARIAEIEPVVRLGRVAEVGRGTLAVSGLGRVAGLGDRVVIRSRGGATAGEVIALSPAGATVLADAAAEGLAIGDPVELAGQPRIAPCDGWVGRIVDPFGAPLDGRPLMPGSSPRSLRAAPPPAAAGWAGGSRPGSRCSTPCCPWCGGSGSGSSPGPASASPA